ncbi:MAG: alpha/beta hydrolase fold domain-containing protein [Acidobacteriota bacterium]
MKVSLRILAPVLLAAPLAFAQQPAPTTAAQAPNRDTSYIDAQGTAHVTRVAPVPQTVSPEAQKFLATQVPDEAPPQSVAERRAGLDRGEARHRVEWSRICPNHIQDGTLAGVPVRLVTPDDLDPANRDKVLLNLHGGGFNADSGSYSESIPIAGFAKMKVVAVLYRLAPEHPFPAAVDDAVAVYKELLKTYKPNHMVLYGTSAGAMLTGEVAVRLKQLGLPLPAALGIFSATGDFARAGDTEALFSVRGLAGPLDPPPAVHDSYYAGKTDPRDPVLSPVYADLRGMPPTLFVSSTRDMLLSGTSNLDRAFLRAGDETQLVVFDALPHAFWYNPNLPEALEANRIMANFFVKALKR